MSTKRERERILGCRLHIIDRANQIVLAHDEGNDAEVKRLIELLAEALDHLDDLTARTPPAAKF